MTAAGALSKHLRASFERESKRCRKETERRAAEQRRQQEAIATMAEELVRTVLSVPDFGPGDTVQLQVRADPPEVAEELAEEVSAYVWQNLQRLAPTAEDRQRLAYVFLLTREGGGLRPLLAMRWPARSTQDESWERRKEHFYSVTDRVKEELARRGITEEEVLKEFERFRRA